MKLEKMDKHVKKIEAVCDEFEKVLLDYMRNGYSGEVTLRVTLGSGGVLGVRLLQERSL